MQNKMKRTCKECDTTRNFRMHGIRQSRCKACEGLQLCAHNKIKYDCKICHECSLGIHKVVRSKCKNCIGSQICSPNRWIKNCKDCNIAGHLADVCRTRITKALLAKKK